MENNLKVTVFGGALPKPGEPAYENAVQLGRMLAQAGFTVMTGGYSGTMEAVSRGAAEAGGHVVGMTCEEIERWRPLQANRWVREVVPSVTLQERLMALINHCDAAIAMPGGIGTLAEIVLMWNRLAIESMPAKPLIVIGQGWRKIFETLYAEQGEHIPQRDRQRIYLVDDIHTAVNRLVAELKPTLNTPPLHRE